MVGDEIEVDVVNDVVVLLLLLLSGLGVAVVVAVGVDVVVDGESDMISL